MEPEFSPSGAVRSTFQRRWSAVRAAWARRGDTRAPSPLYSLRDQAPEVFRTMVDGLTIARVGGLWTILLEVSLAPKLRRSPLAWAAVSVAGAQLAFEQRVLRARATPSAQWTRWSASVDAAMSMLLQITLRQAAAGIPEKERWNFVSHSHNNALWVFPFAGIMSGPVIGPGVLAHGPLIAMSKHSAIARTNVVGVAGGAWFIVRGIRILGRLDIESQVERAAATIDLIEAARTSAANTVMRSALGPLIESVRALSERSNDLSDEQLVVECQRLLPQSRSTEQLSPALINEVAETVSISRRDDSAKLRLQMQRLGQMASLASLAWIGLSAEAARQQPWVRTWQARAVQVGFVANAVLFRVVQPAGIRGNAATKSRDLVNTGMGVGSSLLMHHGAPSESIANIDISVRDNYLIQNAAVSAAPWVIVRNWLLSNALAARTELRAATRPGLPAQVAHLAGYQLAVPLAMQRIVGGMWAAEQKSESAQAARINAEARRGAAMGAQRAGIAAHDYCSQTLQALARDPSLERSQVRSALDDTVRFLEAAFAGQTIATDMELMIRECIGAYRRFGIVPLADVEPLPDLDPAQQRAVLGAINQGLANVLAHSQDTRPTVVIAHRTDPGRVEVNVINSRNAAPAGGTVEGFGLSSLRSEAEAAGGALALQVDESSAVLLVSIPIQPQSAGDP